MKKDTNIVLVSFSKFGHAFGGENKILFITSKYFFACIDTTFAQSHSGASVNSARISKKDAPLWQNDHDPSNIYQIHQSIDPSKQREEAY